MRGMKVFMFCGMVLSAMCAVRIAQAEDAPVAPAAIEPAAPAQPAAGEVASGEAAAVAQDGMISDGKTIKFDYSLSVEGKEVETSQGADPIEYVQGKGELVPGLEKALVGMKVGDEKTVKVSVEEGYGPVDPQAIQEVPRNLIPADIDLKVGSLLEMSDDQGNRFPATVVEIKDDKVKLDFNHPLAGKELTFNVKIVSIK